MFPKTARMNIGRDTPSIEQWTNWKRERGREGGREDGKERGRKDWKEGGREEG